MKFQIQFSRKNKKNITYLSSAEIAQKKVKVKTVMFSEGKAAFISKENGANISSYLAYIYMLKRSALFTFKLF